MLADYSSEWHKSACVLAFVCLYLRYLMKRERRRLYTPMYKYEYE